MVGLNDDQNKVLPSAFRKEGSKIVLLGETKGEFGGSLYIKELFGETVGTLPSFDYSAELRLWELVIEANKKGLIHAAKDVNVGGIAIALSKMAAVSGKGIAADVPVEKSRDIFDESQSRALVEVDASDLETFAQMAMDLGISATVVGEVGGEKVRVNDVELSLEKVKDIYFNTFARTIEQDL
jgi:phosphoribosylformylglycinamidine synthase